MGHDGKDIKVLGATNVIKRELILYFINDYITTEIILSKRLKYVSTCL